MGPLLHCGGWLARHRLRLPAAILLPFLLTAQTDNGKDPVFSTVPFDQWVAQGDHVDIPWRVKISPPQLDEHQRFLVTVTITVDGRHLSKRSPGGELLMLMQIEDSQGHVYQGHGSEALSDIHEELRQADIVYTHNALVIPGDYKVTLAMLHRGTSDQPRDQDRGDHDLGHLALHVAALKNDPLPSPWEGTTPVEIIPKENGAEEWFHPDLTGRLHLPAATRRPVRIELLINPPRSRSGGEFYRQGMSALIAQMKVLSAMEVRNGTINITLLDAQHRLAVTLSRHDGALDWNEIKPLLLKANPNVIDVHHLGTHGEEAEFVASEIRRRLQQDSSSDERRPQPQPILIFLSTPGILGTAGGKSVSLGEFHDATAYLVRYHPPVAFRQIMEAAEANSDNETASRRQGGPPRALPMPGTPQGEPDEKTTTLQDVLRSLKPRIFDVNNPAQFREAVAAILEEISKM
jgi:hypothetical protein